MRLDTRRAEALSERAKIAVMMTWSAERCRPSGRLVHPLWTPATTTARILSDGRSPKITDLRANPRLVLTYRSNDEFLVVEADLTVRTGGPVAELRCEMAASPHGYRPEDFWSADDLNHVVLIEVDAVRMELCSFERGELIVSTWRRP